MSAEHHHGHAGDTHAIVPDADQRRLTAALLLIVGFMVAEVVAGIVDHSLALLSDAAHMLTDAGGAIALSVVALRLATRPAKGGMTFGFKRAEILSAQVNGATLFVLAALIVFKAVRRPRGRVLVSLQMAGVLLTCGPKGARWQTMSGLDRESRPASRSRRRFASRRT
jgi:Co/Zn/Cd efflux system component